MADINYKELFFRDSLPKNLVISYVDDSGNTKTLNNSNIRENMTLNQSICSEQTLQYGASIPSEFKIGLINNGDSLLGKTISVSIKISGYEDSPYSLGSYKVASEELTSDKKIRRIVAYDKLYDIFNTDVADWYNTLLPNEDSTVTFANFVSSFLSHFSLQAENLPNNNNNFTIRKTIDPSELSGKTVLSAICQFSARFCAILYNGKINFFNIESYVGEDIALGKVVNAKWEDYTTEQVTKVKVRNGENDIGGSYGSGDNCYVVNDNFLCYGMSQTELNNLALSIYNAISPIVYTPFNSVTRGNPAILVGSKVNVYAKNKTISSYMISRTISGVQSLRDSIAAEGTEKQTEVSNTVGNSIVQLKGKTNKLERNIYETKQTITDLEEGLTSSITQTANSLTSEIARATGAEGTLQSMIEQTDSRITLAVAELQKEIDGENATYNLSYVPTLQNYPAIMWTYNIPVNNTVKLRDDLKFEYTDEGYSKNARSIAFNEVNSMTYRFTKGDNGVWYWKEIADTDFGLAMSRIAELQIQVDGIETSVEESITNLEGEIYTAQTEITQTAQGLSVEIQERIDATGELSDALEQLGVDVDDLEGTVTTHSTTIAATSQGLTAEISTRTEQFSSLNTSVGNLETNLGNVSSTVSTHSTQISATDSSLTAEINTRTEQVRTINSNVSNLSTTVSNQETRLSATESGLSAEVTNRQQSYSTLDGKIDSTSSSLTEAWTKINATADGLSTEVGARQELAGTVATNSSNISQNATAISARVTKEGGSNSSFGWHLLDNKFSLYSGSTEVFKCDRNGITVNGYTKTTDLEANYATISSLEAEHLYAEQVNVQVVLTNEQVSKRATIEQLNAQTARIDTLYSTYVTADYVSATYATAESLRATNITVSGKLDTVNLSSAIANLDFVSVKGIWVAGDHYYPIQATINGQQKKILVADAHP